LLRTSNRKLITYFSLTCTSFEIFLLPAITPATLVQSQLRVDQVSMILDQPFDAVVRTTALLIRCQRYDEIAGRLQPFSLVPDQARDPDGRLRLIVTRATPVKETIPLNQLKRVCTPVFTFGFYYIRVGEKQDGLRAPVP
jgi:hypothetical protein